MGLWDTLKTVAVTAVTQSMEQPQSAAPSTVVTQQIVLPPITGPEYEPIELERYSRIFAETSFRKDPNDPSRQIEREVVLAEHGLTLAEWNEALVYWTPRVSDANDTAAREFDRIVQAESIRIMNGR